MCSTNKKQTKQQQKKKPSFLQTHRKLSYSTSRSVESSFNAKCHMTETDRITPLSLFNSNPTFPTHRKAIRSVRHPNKIKHGAVSVLFLLTRARTQQLLGKRRRNCGGKEGSSEGEKKGRQDGREEEEKTKKESEDQKETWRTEKPEMWYFLEWQGKGEWWGGGHSVAGVSYHPHWADFFRQSILWPLLVLTVTWLAHQESPWLPWLLGSCPSLVAEKMHILTPAQGERWRVSLGQYGLGTMGDQKEQMASGWDRERR